MSARTVKELRRMQVVSGRSVVVHHPSCFNVRKHPWRTFRPVGDDERYWRGELRPGQCCRPVVPRPDAPEGVPGWNHAL